MITNFTDWLVESNLKPGVVFRTKDKSGDLAGMKLYVKSIKGKDITILLPDGTETLTTMKMLNVDPSSVHPYDSKKDTDITIAK